MKAKSIILFFICSIAMISCEPTSPEVKRAFIGDYWMETSSYATYQGETIYNIHTIWSPVSIYEENGKLLIETNWYGAPYSGGERTRYPYVEEYRERPDFSPRKISYCVQDGDDDVSEIDTVENISSEPFTVIRNGFLYTIKNGADIKSEPIAVKSGSSTTLELEKFTPIDITLTDLNGIILDIIKVKYDYGNIMKKGDVLTWQVDLDLSNKPSNMPQPEIDCVIHKNTLYRK